MSGQLYTKNRSWFVVVWLSGFFILTVFFLLYWYDGFWELLDDPFWITGVYFIIILVAVSNTIGFLVALFIKRFYFMNSGKNVFFVSIYLGISVFLLFFIIKFLGLYVTKT